MEPRSRLEELLGDEQGRAELRRLIAEVREEESRDTRPLDRLRTAYRQIRRENARVLQLLRALLPLLPEQRRQRAEDAAALMHLARMLDLLRELDIIDEDGGIDL